ncbi:hypothetical protein AYJ52_19310 (plasmid) [Acinetobacter pittii]|nr:hypothetical protein AYJ52_19310 [Acinetobacter pittii]
MFKYFLEDIQVKLNKNKSISYIIITTLLSGCFNPFGVDMDSAKSDIAEEIYYNHLRSNYSVLSKGYTINDKEYDINPLSLKVDYAVLGNCKNLFSISKDDVEKKEKAINLTYYAMSSDENIDKTAYLACIDRYLRTTELDAETLNNLINDPDYSRMKLYSDFNNKIKDIKKDGKITLHETLELLSIMGKHTKEEKMQNYNSKVAAL